MKLNQNVAPYYDDFDASKNFLRILTNPSRAVQARELTQAQTILQNQIASFGDHIFRNNTKVLGANITLNKQKGALTVDLLDTGGLAVDVAVFVGQKILGQTSAATATVTHFDSATRTMFVDYIGGEFVAAEVLVTTTGTVLNATISAGGSVYATFADVANGIFYSGGTFFQVLSHEVVVDPSSTTGDYSIGFIVTEEFITSADDSTLRDPASGSYNYNAIGADRWKKSLQLTSYLAADMNRSVDYVEMMVVAAGAIQSSEKTTQYADIIDMMARRTFDESGNYVVEPFKLALETSTNPATVETEMNLNISSGKAYVQGYDVGSGTSKDILIPKAQTSALVNNSSQYVDFGPFFDIGRNNVTGADDIVGTFDIFNREQVQFYSGVNGTGQPVALANIVSVHRNTLGELRFYFSNVAKLTSIFSSVRSFVSVANPTIMGNVEVYQSTGKPLLGNIEKKAHIVSLPETSLKTILANSANYNVVRSYLGVTRDGAGNFVINAPDTTTDFLVSAAVMVATGVNKAQIFEGVDFTVSVNNVNGQISTLTIIPDVTYLGATIDATVPLYKASGNSKTKTITNQLVTLTSDVNGVVTLPHVDIFEFISVTLTGGAVVALSSLTLDDGMRDDVYEYGLVSGLTPSTQYDIHYTNFTHSGTGDYFSVDSYVNAANLAQASNVYSLIKIYTMEDESATFDLKNCIDFRGSVASASGHDTISAEDYFRCDYEFYLPRVDKIGISSIGELSVISGTPAVNPVAPPDLHDVMSIFVLSIPAYTHKPDDVLVDALNRKNFTMHEIGNLEKRISNLEYYSAMNALEQSASDLSVLDAAGNTKFKNGILVDNFHNHTDVGNVGHSEYDCAIDFERGILRGQFTQDALEFSPLNAFNYSANGLRHHAAENIVTLDYTTSLMQNQPKATASINVNPYAVYIWNGEIQLSPSTDWWVDRIMEPVVNKTTGSWAGVGKVFSEWRVSSTKLLGTKQVVTLTFANKITSTVASTIQTSVRTVKSLVADTRVTINDRVVDTNASWFIRTRLVTYSATNLRPNRVFTAWFDGVDVSADCSSLTTDAAGSLTGVFTIPASKFRTGERPFELKDVGATSSAGATYTARGIIKKIARTITSIRGVREVITQETSTRVTNRVTSKKVRHRDPIAQSFLVTKRGGVFLDSVDVYFRVKDVNLPVSVSIVEMENGIPTQSEVPFSGVTLLPANVSISATSATATNFKFSAPIYLNQDAEYAVVIMSNSRGYELFHATLGGIDLITGTTVSKQPDTGVMFKSQNASTWTADQNSDLKYRLHECVFVTSGNLQTVNNDFRPLSPTMKMTAFTPNVDNLVLDKTGIAWSFDTLSQSGILFDDGVDVEFNQIELFDYATNPTPMAINAVLTTTSTNLSPVIDLDRHGIVVTENLVINDGNVLTDRAASYITKTTNLVNPSNDLRVILNSKIRSGSEVNVYFKTNTFIPRFVAVSDNVYNNMVGNTATVYHHATNGTVTPIATCIPTKVENALGVMSVFLKDVSDVGAFINTVDLAGLGLTGVFISLDSTVSGVVSTYSAATTYVVGDKVFNAGFLWESNISGNVANTPSITGSAWNLIEISTTTTVLTDAPEVSWRPMVATVKPVVGIDVGADFYEYEYTPDSIIDENFTAFSVKIEHRTNNPAIVPESSDLRVIAVI